MWKPLGQDAGYPGRLCSFISLGGCSPLQRKSCRLLSERFPSVGWDCNQCWWGRNASVLPSSVLWRLEREETQGNKSGVSPSPQLMAQSVFSLHSNPVRKQLIIRDRANFLFLSKKNLKKHLAVHLFAWLILSPLLPKNSLQQRERGEAQPVAMPSLLGLAGEDFCREKPIKSHHSGTSCCEIRRLITSPVPIDTDTSSLFHSLR